MTHYRVYELDFAGKIAAAEWLEADDDEAAVSSARSRCSSFVPAIEVWRGPHRLAVIDCAVEPDRSTC